MFSFWPYVIQYQIGWLLIKVCSIVNKDSNHWMYSVQKLSKTDETTF